MELILDKILGSIVYPFRLIFAAIGKLIPGYRKFAYGSTASLVAVPLFFVLLFISLGVCLAYTDGSKSVAIPIIAVAATVVLAGLISGGTYLLMKMLGSKNDVSFDDVDEAWKVGLSALARNGINVKTTPFFLITGSPDSATATNLMASTEFNLPVKNATNSSGTLHWFANEQGIFLFATQATCVSRLQWSISNPPEPEEEQPTGVSINDQDTFIGEPMDINKTITGEDAAPDLGISISASTETGVSGTVLSPEVQANEQNSAFQSFNSKGILSDEEQVTYSQKLKYLCGLIQKAREPGIPLNGILSIVSFERIKTHTIDMQTAMDSDLETIRNEFNLRTQVIVLITEMQHEIGFMELINRLGVNRAKEQRIGKGFNVWANPTYDNLNAVASHACGLFEDLSYKLYQAKNGLTKHSGNRRLFTLLCKVRGQFADALGLILGNGVGYNLDTEQHKADQTLLFNGCYFGSTGANPKEQGFVKSVFLRMTAHKADYEWTKKANDRDLANKRLSTIFGMVGILSSIGLAYLVCVHFLLS